MERNFKSSTYLDNLAVLARGEAEDCAADARNKKEEYGGKYHERDERMRRNRCWCLRRDGRERAVEHRAERNTLDATTGDVTEPRHGRIDLERVRAICVRGELCRRDEDKLRRRFGLDLERCKQVREARRINPRKLQRR